MQLLLLLFLVRLTISLPTTTTPRNTTPRSTTLGSTTSIDSTDNSQGIDFEELHNMLEALSDVCVKDDQCLPGQACLIPQPGTSFGKCTYLATGLGDACEGAGKIRPKCHPPEQLTCTYASFAEKKAGFSGVCSLVSDLPLKRKTTRFFIPA